MKTFAPLIATAICCALATAHAGTGYVWKNVAIGGGGYVVGIVPHPTEQDLVYARTDVGGAYRWDPVNKGWIPLTDSFTAKTLFSIESIALDPKNSNIVYIAAGDYGTPNDVLKSADRGVTWTRTNLNVPMGGNDAWRWAGERLAVDPNNSAVLYFGSRSNGLWRSLDGTATWQQVTSFPTNGTTKAGIVFVVFDPGSETAGSSATIYAGVIGAGVYRSTDAGQSWQFLSGGPPPDRNPERAVIGAGGSLYVTFYTSETELTGGVWKYQQNGWTDVTPVSGKNYDGLSVDAHNPNHLIAAEHKSADACAIYNTTDAGAHWSAIKYSSHSNVPWRPASWFSSATAALALDPVVPNRVWYTDWYGVWITDDVTASPSAWYTAESGHEEVVVFTLVSPPTGPFLFSGSADVGGFRHDLLGSFPPQRFNSRPPSTQGIGPDITGIDFSEANPNVVVRVGGDHVIGTGGGGYSLDGGNTWTMFPNAPNPALGRGRVAISAGNPESIVWIPGDGVVYRTADRGQTWQTGAGAPANALGPAQGLMWTSNQPLASDRVDPALFYLYQSGGFYRSMDGAKTWSKTASLPVSTSYVVKAAPGMREEVWVGLNSGGLYRSSNAGATFTQVKSVGQAQLFAFGKGVPATGPARPRGRMAPRATTPTVFVYGMIGQISGIFSSSDMGTTWVQINPDDTMLGDGPRAMEGDRQVYGRVYLGTSGRGIFYGEPGVE